MELSKEELKEMMSIFKVESEEHLKNLNKGLLKLEEAPGSKELLDELFRTAHSIKGSARMMGFDKIEAVSHKIEDIFGLLRKGKASLSAEDFDLVYEGVDLISQIIEKISADGTDESINIQALNNRLEKLVAEKNLETDAPVKPKKGKAAPADKSVKKEETPEEPLIDVQLTEDELVPQSEQFQPSTDQSNTEIIVEKADGTGKNLSSDDAFIRVPTKRLDDLMNQVSELITTRIKSQQRLADIRKILDFCEEWSQQFDRVKQIADKTSGRLSSEQETGPGNGKLTRMKELISHTDLKYLINSFHNSFERISKLLDFINDLHDKHSEENQRTAVITGDIQDNLRIIRLLPISTIFDLYPRMIRDIAKLQNKKIKFEVYGAETRVDKKILEELKDPLIHLLRNAIDHGVEAPSERELAGKPPEGQISIRASYAGNMVQIEITDDGKGIDTERILQIAIKKGYIKQDQVSEVTKTDLISLIFHSGFSTAKIITDLSGRGVGLDVVKSNIEKIKGTIETESEKGKGSKFILKIPLTLSTTHALIVDVGGDQYSLPIDYIERTVRLTEEELWTGGANPFVMVEGHPVPLFKLEDVLGNPRQRLKAKGLLKFSGQQKIGQIMNTIETNKFPAVIFNASGRRAAFLVDRLLDEQEVVVKSLGHQLKRVRNVAGSTILGDGRISIILDPNDLVKSVQGAGGKFVFKERRRKDLAKKKILVVDDSITTRTLEKNILESAGYSVVIATNGQEGYQKLHEGVYDVVVSDVEMPLMNGFEFAAKVRKESKFPDIPFILCTSLESDKDKRRGIEVGANAYIVKGSFDQSNLLETIEKLI
jgi:two-component system chemotaxis sensor kinase CheA